MTESKITISGTIEATVIRADGTVEELGVIADLKEPEEDED